MRKTFWMPAVTAAVTAISISTLWAVQQPADTVVPPPTDAPIAGPNAAAATTGPAPTTQEVLTKASYAVGYDIGKNMKEAEFQLDVANFTAGLNDSLAGTASKLTDEEVQVAMGIIQQQMMERAQAKEAEATQKMEAMGIKNAAEGKIFLEANKAKPNIKTTASGLQYEITTEGTGPTPKASDVVKVHYTGTLLDGTKFDSSVDRGEPIEFPLENVIPGWTEGLQLFKVGSKGKLYIPGELAYGPRGSGRIPPNSTLIFEVELLAITPPATQPAGGLPILPTQVP